MLGREVAKLPSPKPPHEAEGVVDAAPPRRPTSGLLPVARSMQAGSAPFQGNHIR